MPSSTEFMLAEAALQAEFARRKISPPEVEDDLSELTEGYLAELFSEKTDLKRVTPIKSTYLTRMREEDMAKTPNITNVYIGTNGARQEDEVEEEEESEDDVEDEERAVWDSAYVSDLPNSAFAIVSADGERHLPHHDKLGKPDKAHVRNALARLNQVKGASSAQKSRAKSHLQAHAKTLGMDVSDDKSADDGLDDGERAVKMSYEQRMKSISQAVRKYGILEGCDYWPIATYEDHVIASDWYTGKFYRFDYALEDNEIKLQEPTEVMETFVDVSEAAKSAPFQLLRQRDGKFRWLAISSNTYKDSYKENFSKDSLEEAVKAMQKSGDHGELRLEHVLTSRVGTCDFSKVLGSFLVESGTFDSTPRAKKVVETLQGDEEGKWKVSIGFFYNPKYLVDGEYKSHVRIHERSITQIPANTVTAISLAELGGSMESADTKARLAAVLGGDEDMAEEMLTELRESVVPTALGRKDAKKGITVRGVRKDDATEEGTDDEKEDEVGPEIIVVDEDGTEYRAVREEVVNELRSGIKRSELRSIIAEVLGEQMKELRADVLKEVKKESNSELPRAVKHRFTLQGKVAETDAEKKEAKEVVEAAAGNSSSAFWSGFPGGQPSR